jgi:hypothetical protein
VEFKDSLQEGIKYEIIVLGIIKEKYPSAHKIEGYCKEYDIYVPENDMKIEVKTDKKSNFTGNLVVEIEMFDKPSALFTTKSNYWVFCDGEELMWITPAKIKDIIIWNGLKAVSFVGNGDTHKKRAILVPKHLIREASKIHKLK